MILSPGRRLMGVNTRRAEPSLYSSHRHLSYCREGNVKVSLGGIKLSCLKTNRDDTIVICLSQIDAPVVVDPLDQRKIVCIQIVYTRWAMTKAEQ